MTKECCRDCGRPLAADSLADVCGRCFSTPDRIALAEMDRPKPQPVDVLAVMGAAADHASFFGHQPAGAFKCWPTAKAWKAQEAKDVFCDDARKLREARAAVAELVEAATAGEVGTHPHSMATKIVFRGEAADRLRAALARIGGGP